MLSDEDLQSLGLVAEGFRKWYKVRGIFLDCELPIALLSCLNYGLSHIIDTNPDQTTEETLKYDYATLSITHEAAAEALEVYYHSDADAPFMDDVPELVYHMVVLPRYERLRPTSARVVVEQQRAIAIPYHPFAIGSQVWRVEKGPAQQPHHMGAQNPRQ